MSIILTYINIKYGGCLRRLAALVGLKIIIVENYFSYRTFHRNYYYNEIYKSLFKMKIYFMLFKIIILLSDYHIYVLKSQYYIIFFN